MTLGRRIQLLLAAFFVLLTVNAALALGDIRARDEVLAEIGDLQPARVLVNDLTSHMVDQETGQRGYVITGDDTFLRPYVRGQRIAAATLAQLDAMFSDDEELTALTTRIDESWLRWREEAAEPELAAARRDGAGAAAELVASGRGRRLFDLLRADIRALREAIAAREAELEARLQELRERLTVTLFASFFLGVGLLGVAAVLLRRWITVPFGEVGAAVRRVAAGDLEHPIPRAGPADLSALGADVDHMRRLIVSQLAAEVRAREALEQHGPAVVTLRSQLLPSRAELPDAVEFAGRIEPAKGILAGDWYDFVALDDDRLMLTVVDVSGHGPVAGVFALRAKLLLLAALRQGFEPGRALGWVADHLGDTGETFLTCVAVEVHRRSGAARYANAGHPPPLVATEHDLEFLDPTGPLLGPLSASWETRAFDLPEGGLLVAYTDGVVEARRPGSSEFGVERLRDLVVAHDGGGPQDLVDTCVAAVRAHVGGRLADDLTVVALRRSGAPPEPAGG